MILISLIIALIVLIIASITDIQKREVHDYVSYGLMFVALGISIIATVIAWDYRILAQTVMGFLIGLGLAFAMFYLGQWGGGDSKLLMGLGAVFGFNVFAIFGQINLWLIWFLAAIIFVGALYGLIWSIGLVIRNRKKFIASLMEWSKKKEIRIMRIVLMVFTVLAVVAILLFIEQSLQLLMLALVALIFLVFYLWFFIKIIEESCMVKTIPVSKVTEGDWILHDVFWRGKYITGPKELGITKDQIALLKKHKIKTVIIKEGIPFIPVFLIAFVIVVAIYYTGWWMF